MAAEQWLLQHWFSIGVLLVAVVGMFWKQKSLEKRFDEHVKTDNPIPHPQCPKALGKLDSLKEDVEESKEEIKYVSRTLYNFLYSQGHRIPEPPNGKTNGKKG